MWDKSITRVTASTTRRPPDAKDLLRLERIGFDSQIGSEAAYSFCGRRLDREEHAASNDPPARRQSVADPGSGTVVAVAVKAMSPANREFCSSLLQPPKP